MKAVTLHLYACVYTAKSVVKRTSIQRLSYGFVGRFCLWCPAASSSSHTKTLWVSLFNGTSNRGGKHFFIYFFFIKGMKKYDP